jgi:hypothetical protein
MMTPTLCWSLQSFLTVILREDLFIILTHCGGGAANDGGTVLTSVRDAAAVPIAAILVNFTKLSLMSLAYIFISFGIYALRKSKQSAS